MGEAERPAPGRRSLPTCQGGLEDVKRPLENGKRSGTAGEMSVGRKRKLAPLETRWVTAFA
jgi:hypothetical protein